MERGRQDHQRELHQLVQSAAHWLEWARALMPSNLAALESLWEACAVFKLHSARYVEELQSEIDALRQRHGPSHG